ncbi:hypothetical protein ACHAPV_000079 [Trichoderma viride]
MALVIGLVAAAARALASDHNGSNPGYNGNGQNYNNSNGYNNGYNSNGYTRGYNNGYANNNYNGNNAAPYAPYAAYGTCTHMTGSRRSTRRMERRMRKAERKAERNDMVMSLMSSGSRSRAAVPAPSQPVGGVSYTNYGEGPAPRGVYSSEAQGSAAGSYRDRMPVGAPEGYRWRDEQSRDRNRDVGSSSARSSMDGLPSYEQAVQKPRKS